jgi:RNA polymerase sigma factor (TIGR02999 family)
MGEPGDLTGCLLAWRNGKAPSSRLIEGVYGELRRLAHGYMRRERADHSLPPTALVHEAYLRLIDQSRVRWQNRAHFFAVAAHVMRRILVDHARTRGAAKRGGGLMVALENIDGSVNPFSIDVLALDAALEELTRIDPRQGRLVELRFFGGLNVTETAAALDVSPVTVKRDWALAKAWLYRALRERP